jgi:hypothetical protein
MDGVGVLDFDEVGRTSDDNDDGEVNNNEGTSIPLVIDVKVSKDNGRERDATFITEEVELELVEDEDK